MSLLAVGGLVRGGLKVFEERIVGISCLGSTVERRSVMGVHRCIDAQPLRQIGVGNEQATESDSISLAAVTVFSATTLDR